MTDISVFSERYYISRKQLNVLIRFYNNRDKNPPCYAVDKLLCNSCFFRTKTICNIASKESVHIMPVLLDFLYHKYKKKYLLEFFEIELNSH